MKTVFKTILFSLSALISLSVLYLLAQTLRLKWWVPTENGRLVELSEDQKAEDFRYRLDLTRWVSLADAVWETAGLDDPLEQPEARIDRARRTASNREFAAMITQ
jgi:hypothetical protein